MYRVPTEVIDVLADLIDDKQGIKYVAQRVGMPLGMIDLNGPPKVLWLTVLQEAMKHELLGKVLDAVAADYPALNWQSLRQLLDRAGKSVTVAAPAVKERDWRGRLNEFELEKITGSQPTFLPLRFFELGQLKAKSVAFIDLPTGSGTGFLTEGNLLLTNNHVISDVAAAKSASLVFNYQQAVNGSPGRTTTYRLAPERGFATSKSRDWTATRIDAEVNAEWGSIPLRDCPVREGEFVNIVQHPMGGPKVVAMYHNVVVYADEDRVQYLTDTLPGSSGSPVFRSDWSLVAIHHAGGPIGKSGMVCNEGITVRRLIKDLTSSGLI